MTPTLQINAVGHDYDHPVLQGVSLTVGAGEVVCLLGPSGCGKSTLLRLVAGLERLQRGTILVDGRRVSGGGVDVPPERRGVGMVFQDLALFPHLTIGQNIGFGLARPDPARVATLLDQIGLAGATNRYPHTLSGGQQQRVAVARALAPEPQVILLDEPFSGLDAGLRARLRADVRLLLKSSRSAAIVVTHDIEEAMALADRIAVMHAGVIEQDDLPAAIYARPASAYVARCFGDLNEFRGKVTDGVVMTPFGPVNVDQLATGTAVSVLIRPEGLRVVEPVGLQVARGEVVDVRALGANARLSVRLFGSAGDDRQLVDVPSDDAPKAGATIGLALDHRRAFVFSQVPT